MLVSPGALSPVLQMRPMLHCCAIRSVCTCMYWTVAAGETSRAGLCGPYSGSFASTTSRGCAYFCTEDEDAVGMHVGQESGR